MPNASLEAQLSELDSINTDLTVKVIMQAGTMRLQHEQVKSLEETVAQLREVVDRYAKLNASLIKDKTDCDVKLKSLESVVLDNVALKNSVTQLTRKVDELQKENHELVVEIKLMETRINQATRFSATASAPSPVQAPIQTPKQRKATKTPSSDAMKPKPKTDAPAKTPATPLSTPAPVIPRLSLEKTEPVSPVISSPQPATPLVLPLAIAAAILVIAFLLHSIVAVTPATAPVGDWTGTLRRMLFDAQVRCVDSDGNRTGFSSLSATSMTV